MARLYCTLTAMLICGVIALGLMQIALDMNPNPNGIDPEPILQWIVFLTSGVFTLVSILLGVISIVEVIVGRRTK